mmetsp:Transcript_15675/g.21085  ORF Transcript_15675/g.21085 Transcript_15675/m.21085 type:complete len:111 (+) Transcript_15675:12-344(+)
MLRYPYDQGLLCVYGFFGKSTKTPPPTLKKQRTRKEISKQVDLKYQLLSAPLLTPLGYIFDVGVHYHQDDPLIPHRTQDPTQTGKRDGGKACFSSHQKVRCSAAAMIQGR